MKPRENTTESTQSSKHEWLWGLFLLALGVGSRIAFVHAFPTLPLSDFRGLIDFALDLRDRSWFVPGYYWDVFNLGPPIALSLVFRVFRSDPAAVARYATAVWCGLLPLFPFLFWRRVLPFWVRMTGGLLLAVWPGQIFFSSVVSQENWMVTPAVALACLAARALLGGKGSPVAAGLFYAVVVAMRQEMLVVSLPLVLGAAGLFRRQGWRPQTLLALGFAVGLPFFALALQRQRATGELALASVHGGFTLLGTVMPGATRLYWDDPVSYIASVEPELARDRHRMFREAKRLAWDEILRRPGFQTLRAASMALWFPFRSDAELLYWSVRTPEALPLPLRARAERFALAVYLPLKGEMIAIQALFLAALGLGLARRNPAILAVALTALSKIALHAVVVSAPRFYMPITALELVVIALGLAEAAKAGRRAGWKALAWGGLAAVSLFLLSRPLRTEVLRLDRIEQRTYRFTLTSYEHPGVLRCVVGEGRLTALGDVEAVLETLAVSPQAGDRAIARCRLTQTGPPGSRVPLRVEVLDSFEPGGLAGRMAQRLALDGREVVAHDPAAVPGTGWVASPAVSVGGGESHDVQVTVETLSTDPILLWGPAAAARIRVTRAP